VYYLIPERKCTARSMDVKAKWSERSAKVKTKAGSPSTTNDREANHGNRVDTDAKVSEVLQAPIVPDSEVLAVPGAVAVYGPGYHREDEASTVQTGRLAEEDEATDAPFHVDSYAVNEGATEEEIRRRILARTPRAEVVSGEAPKSRRHWLTAVILSVVVAVAVAIGVAVPLSKGKNQAGTITKAPNEKVLASIEYIEWQGDGGFSSAIRAKTSVTDVSAGSPITTGAVEFVSCAPKQCAESDDSCVAYKFYSPGCCAGSECPVETKCGEDCQNPPESCYLTDPSDLTCTDSTCYTCNMVNGEVGYLLRDTAFAIDCLNVGTAIRPKNGETYKWAIVCGPQISGFNVEQNRAEGEYQCAAIRKGANYSDDNGGLVGVSLPCQYIALAECGCGPSDMYTFGLPDPSGPCLPEGDCPILCEDAGTQYARNLCNSFPGNISWWEGQNAFNESMFYEDSMAPKYRLEIYVKGYDE
jgi:hypothetical protein